VTGVDPVGVVLLVAVLVAATAFGLLRRRTDGRVKAVPAEAAADRLGADVLGHDLGSAATLVQFSTSFCQPCRATRRILDEVSSMVDGVEHVEIDAESRLDLVRRLDIMRTPTVLVLGPAGEIAHRATGLPRKADVIAALGAVIR
jgi:thiol-disulfide isomerase/thioredoxin